MNIGKLKRSTQIAIMTGAGSGAVEKTASGTSPLTLSDSVVGNIHSITVKGHSEIVDGVIKSIGDKGWGVVDLGTLEWEYISDPYHSRFQANYLGIKPSADLSIKADILCAKYDTRSSNDIYNHIYNKSIAYHGTLHKIWVYDTTYTDAATFKTAMSGVLLYYLLADTTGATPIIGIISKNGEGQGTAATITTGLPLRSTIDGTVYDELTNEKVITRCEVVEGEVVPLVTPTETLLTSAETTALSALETYDPTTVISITDNPSITVKYMGKRAARTAPKKRTNRKKKS